MKAKPRIWGNEREAAEDWLSLRQDTITLNKGNIYLYEKNEWDVENPEYSIIKRHLSHDLLEFYGELVRLQDKRRQEIEKEQGLKSDDWVEANDAYKLYYRKQKKIGDYTTLHNIYKSVKYILQDMPELEFDESDIQNDYLHYKNGKLNISTGEFSKRTIEDFVAHRINYDYVDAVSEEIYNYVKTVFLKFEPEEDKHKLIMQWIYYSLTGYTHEQKFMHFWGPTAENGKSTLLKILRLCFPNYVSQIDARVLCKSEQQRDKSLEFIANNRALRLGYTEELGTKSIDEGFVKEFVDGEPIEFKKMYASKQVFKHKVKLTNCSNFELQSDQDEGVKRRAIIYECKSKFIDINSQYARDTNWQGEDDWENRIFKKDPLLSVRFHEDEYKIATIKYIMTFKNSKIEIPQVVMEDTKESFINSDDWLSTILEYFVITRSKEDLVAKSDVFDILDDLFSESKSKQAFNKRLKQYGIAYHGSKRAENKDGQKEQGSYSGIKIREIDSSESDDED